MSHSRLPAKVRTQQILDAATEIARTKGFSSLRRSEIAERAGVSTGLVNVTYGTMAQLRRAVMRRAVHDRILNVIAEGLVLNDPVARKAPEELRRAAVATIR